MFLFNNARAGILIVAVFHGMVDIVSMPRAATGATLVAVNAGLIAAAVLVAIRYAPTLRLPGSANASEESLPNP